MDISISGASDDLVEIDGVPEYDEFCNPSYSSIKFKGNLIAPDGSGVRVIVIYDNDGVGATGCWSVAIGRMDEDAEYPEWPVTILTGDRAYNVTAVIEAPDGTILVPDEYYKQYGG